MHFSGEEAIKHCSATYYSPVEPGLTQCCPVSSLTEIPVYEKGQYGEDEQQPYSAPTPHPPISPTAKCPPRSRKFAQPMTDSIYVRPGELFNLDTRRAIAGIVGQSRLGKQIALAAKRLDGEFQSEAESRNDDGMDVVSIAGGEARRTNAGNRGALKWNHKGVKHA